MSFIGGIKVKADEFYNCWRKYDKDGNGYIEKGELDDLLKDMVERSGMDINSKVIAEARAHYMRILDENQDGRLDANELAKLLVPEENFLVNFRNKEKLSSADFMKIWRKYDSDKNGYIDKDEITQFLHDLMTVNGQDRAVPVQKLEEYRDFVLTKFDTNKDGRLDIKELVDLLPLEENFLTRFKGLKSLPAADFDEIFKHYDQDLNGCIEGEELEGLIRDLLRRSEGRVDPDYTDVKKGVQDILEHVDTNKDGKLQKEELRMFFSSSK